MFFQVTWFVLWSVLWAVYFMLDGFDLGAGILHSFIARDEHQKRAVIHTLGPVWSGNEVWLVTAGGATFAAFPTTYALMFSYLYTPLMLILFTLIIRGVALEFRGQSAGPAWRMLWDGAIFTGSLVPALLFGVVFGNIFEGLPMDAQGYHGSLLALLNPYGLLTGVLFGLLFLMHGALWLAFKTSGDLSARSAALAAKLGWALLAAAVAFLGHTALATKLYANFVAHPVWFGVPLLAVAALVLQKVFLAQAKLRLAFYASCATILMVVFTGTAGLFPNLIPSNADVAYSLTIFNSSSSQYTLKIMTGVALVFVPIVIAYQIWVYRVFRAPLPSGETQAAAEPY